MVEVLARQKRWWLMVLEELEDLGCDTPGVAGEIGFYETMVGLVDEGLSYLGGLQ